MKSLFLNLFFISTVLAVVSVGCSGPDPINEHVANLNKTNIQKVSSVYGLYAALKQNNGPESKEQLIDFIMNDSSIDRNLNLMGIEREKVDQYFSSSVDQQEFKIRWGVQFNPDGAAIPLVFDTNGDDAGMRRVALSDGRVLEVESDSEYKKLFAGKISKSDAGAAAWEGGGGEAEPEQPDIQ